MLRYVNLRDHAISRKIDYKKVLCESIITHSGDKDSELSVIIPAYGRTEFLEPLIDSFRRAVVKSPVSVNFFIVEHSEVQQHKRVALRIGINHIWIPKNLNTPFNKCLAMNIGAIVSESDSYIFHDLDCLVQSNFFSDLYKNIDNKGSKAIQTFSDRRVLYLNAELTSKSLMMELDIDSLVEGGIDPEHPSYNGVTPPKIYGAPGGSIWIQKETFTEVGGYDPNIFFGYSPEDIFFWDKVSTITKMDTCTDPRVEIFHMMHPLTDGTNPHLSHLKGLHLAYTEGSTHTEKLEFLKMQREFLLSAYE